MKDNDFFKEVFRLRKFYTLYREFLEIHFSGYTINSSDKVNRQYLQLCSKIESILKDSKFKDFKKGWKPFEHLLDHDPEYPEGDWEYGGRKLCADYANEIEKIFIENGEREYGIPRIDGELLNKTREFIKQYRILKKESDKIFDKNAEKMGEEFNKKQTNQIRPTSNTSDTKIDLQKSLKALYDDLLEVENGPDRNTFGFKHRLQVIHENLQDVEMRICAEFSLGDFGVLPDFESTHYRRGDSGMDQMLKSQIKRLAIEIELNLEQNNTTKTTPDDDDPVETVIKHKWTRQEKIGLTGLGVMILGIVVAFLV